MNIPSSGALFAGYGGLDLAVREVLGAYPTWVSEIEPGPCKILADRFPGAVNLGDITTVDWPTVPRVKILTGGFPCQDVSHAGAQAGMRDGTRSGLWYQMARAIQTLRPELVVVENVRGLLSAEADGYVEPCPWCLGEAGDGEPAVRALGAVLADLASLGYDAAWCGVRASDVGAPHGRFRVFVLAWPADAPSAGLEARREGRRGGGAAADAEGDPGWLGDRVGRAVAGLGGRAADLKLLPSPRTSDTNGDGGLDLRTAVALLPTPRATDGTKGGPNQRGSSGDLMLPSAVTLLPTPPVGDSKAARNSTALRHRTPPTGVHAGDTLTDVVRPTRGLSRDFGAYAPAVARWEAVLGRPAPAPTEPTGKGGAHRLSPRFVEWLMGLDDGWVTGLDLTRNEQLKALGNGVVPQQAAAALRHLLAVRAAALAGQEVAA